jgi:hypothetical protein
MAFAFVHGWLKSTKADDAIHNVFTDLNVGEDVQVIAEVAPEAKDNEVSVVVERP